MRLPKKVKTGATKSNKKVKQSPEMDVDAICDSDSDQERERATPRENQANAREETMSLLWVDKHMPLIERELAVHPRKISDVREWLQSAVSTDPLDTAMRNLHKSHRLLALTGKSGVGKTATIRMLAMELDVDVVEWVNPTHGYASDDSYSPSILSKFTEFVSSARKANTLVFTNESELDESAYPLTKTSKKLILIEDLPNLSHTATRTLFHAVLQSHVQSQSAVVYPIVLILSDTVASSSDHSDWRASSFESGLNLKNLVPEDVRTSSGFSRIHFNPIAPSILVKSLNRIIDQEFGVRKDAVLKKPTRQEIESVAHSCGGDIRNALNTLQFLALNRHTNSSRNISSQERSQRISQQSSSQRSAAKNDSISKSDVGNRNVNLIFYHALNKILIGKRLSTSEQCDQFPGSSESFSTNNDTNHDMHLPRHLSHHERKPLKSNPENVFEASHVDSDTFTAYLAQNYTSYFTDIEECVLAADAYCTADTLSGSWKNRSSMSVYSASIACRGTVFARQLPAPSQKFGGMNKPQLFTALKEKRETLDTLQESKTRWHKAWAKYLESEDGDSSKGNGNGVFRISHNHSSQAIILEVLPFASQIIGASSSRTSLQIAPTDTQLMNTLSFFGPRICKFTAMDENDCAVEISEEYEQIGKTRGSGGIHSATIMDEDVAIEDDIED
ncbi:Cell cycle checkpoint protein rad17 [Chytriomyces hyalinus]|nr:Cell cycle checkpoint protein rad17 [Chytriomyces hyalinus]